MSGEKAGSAVPVSNNYMEIKEYFKDKKVTVMGLGLLGRGIGIIRFLTKHGSHIVVTDLKKKEELRPALSELRGIKNIDFILGRHRLKDFQKKDMVIKAAGVPLNSKYINEAKNQGIPVEMDASLFAKLSPAKVVGITGTRGKSTVTHLLYNVLKIAAQKEKRSFNGKKPKVYLGGNVKGLATLPLLEKAREGDLVVLELDSWQLQGFGEAKISPQISVFTNFMEDHQNYYNSMKRYFRDKENIFRYQGENDFLILTKQAFNVIRRFSLSMPKSRKTIVPLDYFPKSWNLKLLGNHNKQNAALVLAVADVLRISRKITKKVFENFKGVEGRLEVIGKIKGVTFINDTTATTPDAVMAALKSLNEYKINLIAGGSDKALDYRKMMSYLRRSVKNLILLPGSATEKMTSFLPSKPSFGVYRVEGAEQAVNLAWNISKKGDVVLLSPGATSFGIFRNEFDRGERFKRAIVNLKK